ncbi:MAG: NUDIX domain-containing protein [Thermoleophilia bacterium]|nr:NUDIX domain-containing protein [Thermoleophilia bacterium]
MPPPSSRSPVTRRSCAPATTSRRCSWSIRSCGRSSRSAWTSTRRFERARSSSAATACRRAPVCGSIPRRRSGSRFRSCANAQLRRPSASARVPDRFSRTWDGLPVSREPPHGATVAVWRARRGGREWLLLHRRAAGGPEFEGEWAWTPPSGARFPEESVEACARRELAEETGLVLEPEPTVCGSDEWTLFVAQAPPEAEIRLDAEHDRYLWASLEEACRRCLPRVVAEQLRCVAAALESAARSSAAPK